MSHDVTETIMRARLKPLRFRRDVATDSYTLQGARVSHRITGVVLDRAWQIQDVLIQAIRNMAEHDPVVAAYERDLEIEIHPVMVMSTLELLAY